MQWYFVTGYVMNFLLHYTLGQIFRVNEYVTSWVRKDRLNAVRFYLTNMNRNELLIELNSGANS